MKPPGGWHRGGQGRQITTKLLELEAHVEETYPDDDGLVRKVRRKTAEENLDDNGRTKGLASSLYKPVQKLVSLLPREECEDRGIPTWGALS